MTFASSGPYHSGELLVQQRAGTRGVADELGFHISTFLNLNSGVDLFLSQLPLVWISSLSSPNKTSHSQPSNVWVSPVFGNPGFVHVKNHHSLEIDLQHGVANGDILLSNLQQQVRRPVGMLALDPARRRRYRINGALESNAKVDTCTQISVIESFPNCPKYIQKRILDPNSATLDPVPSCSADNVFDSGFQEDDCLSKSDINFISSSDTFYFGTSYDDTRLDVNHRGGQPGFVRVTSPNELYWPDYRGNGMFQSLGNLHGNDRAGITFLDYTTGELLQITGRAETVWDARKTLNIEAAERAIRFFVEKVRRSVGPVTNFRWQTIEISPYNPVVNDKVSDDIAAARRVERYPMEVKLVKITRESRSVKTFRFLAPERIKFLPGQYASFEFDRKEDMDTSEEVINRTWTLSESPNSVDGDVTLEISVKRKNGGVISTWLHDHAQVGVSARLLGIGGEMTPFGDGAISSKILLISGGVGITPNMSILRGIGAFQTEADVVFIHQEREIEDMPFQSEIMRRARASRGRTRVMRLVSGMGDGGNEEEDGVICGRVDKEVLLSMMTDLSDREIYLCGPRGFMESVTRSLLEAGALKHRIKTEDFSF